MWERDGISCKWAPFQLYGPSVSVENAMEFIRRTDTSFVNPGIGYSNDRVFEACLAALLDPPGYMDYLKGHQDFDEKVGPHRWDYSSHFRESWGAVELEHLASAWVATAYIDGPHGAVHPDGTVRAAMNFGKYPSLGQIEDEMSTIAGEFPWLSFDLFVWDNWNEEAEGDPDFAWSLKDGAWKRTDSVPTEPRARFDPEKFVANLATGRRTETTWTIDQIVDMWGSHIERARSYAMDQMDKLRTAEP